MFQRKILYILSLFLVLFVWNIGLYQYNEDYRFLLKKFKYKEDAQVIEDAQINDDYTLWEIDVGNTVTTWATSQTPTQLDDVAKEDYKSFTGADLIKKNPQNEEQLELSTEGKKILELIWEGKVEKVENHASLFDMTTEYPDNYLEYSSEDLTIYFFPTKTYEQVIDIFYAISQGLPFSLNKNDTFGEKSFYINISKDFEDEYVRLVVLYKKEVFWLKIKKDYYNDVKKSLKLLKK